MLAHIVCRDSVRLMAIFVDSLECGLCGKPMKSNQALYHTTSMVLAGPEEIHGLNDACVHWDCFALWKHRHLFAKHCFAVLSLDMRSNPSWTRLFENHICFVDAGWCAREVSVVLAETASEHRIPFVEWERWLQEPANRSSRHEIETRPLEEAKASLLAVVPTRQSILGKRPTNLFREDD